MVHEQHRKSVSKFTNLSPRIKSPKPLFLVIVLEAMTQERFFLMHADKP